MLPALLSSRAIRAPVMHHRAFSASAAALAKKQFVVIAYDYTDAEAPARRQSVRPKHLEGARELKKSGALQLGGAFLSDHSDQAKMVGSIMIFNAESKEEVEKMVKRQVLLLLLLLLLSFLLVDLYVTGKVWEKYDIIPFRQATIE
ncbi:hypothetical protein BGW38_003718 [Lunasporangiospora selenospora]|uniref:YCII-related domain-containing protein n=1 Tax=Lunasporangiospora selenospora TaxID=979761 RepID=A0A9P6KHU3_9FUNG|nr:hypothetical protein BGW38_003718 [Lunasporangiospora selenospora]